ncbi:MAG: DUF805 domain-containing protein [Deltaproteobacteria bacterium]|nr:DUF805 domain-containing protein [Deltaproteobacteria bacterium]
MESFQRDFLEVITRKFATFEGRARRREFWMFVLWAHLLVLVLVLVGIGLGFIVPFAGGLFLVLTLLACLAMTVPSLALWTRRLHDMGQPGWWLLLNIPGLGFIPLIMALVDSQPGDNQFGPNPKGL